MLHIFWQHFKNKMTDKKLAFLEAATFFGQITMFIFFIRHFVFRRQSAEFFFSTKSYQMKASQNNKYDIMYKHLGSCAGLKWSNTYLLTYLLTYGGTPNDNKEQKAH